MELLAALLHDAHGLAHFLHANAVTVVIVAVLADGDVEIELAVALVGLRLPEVPGGARTAYDDPRETPLEAILQGYHADVDVALLEDAVIGQQTLDVVEHLGVRLAELSDVLNQFGWQV